MIVLVVAALGSGIVVLGATWSAFGLFALLLAPVVASATGLLAGLLLAFLRRSKLPRMAVRIGASGVAAPDRAANNSLLEQRAS
ncbi:hypothetical protein ACRAWG_27445 [Methylobacterium sp. P31]